MNNGYPFNPNQYNPSYNPNTTPTNPQQPFPPQQQPLQQQNPVFINNNQYYGLQQQQQQQQVPFIPPNSIPSTAVIGVGNSGGQPNLGYSSQQPTFPQHNQYSQGQFISQSQSHSQNPHFPIQPQQQPQQFYPNSQPILQYQPHHQQQQQQYYAASSYSASTATHNNNQPHLPAQQVVHHQQQHLQQQAFATHSSQLSASSPSTVNSHHLVPTYSQPLQQQQPVHHYQPPPQPQAYTPAIVPPQGPPGQTTVVTSQLYYAADQSIKQQQPQVYQPPLQLQQQQQQPLMITNGSNQPLINARPASFSNLLEMTSNNDSSAYLLPSHSQNSSQSSLAGIGSQHVPKTNLLSHADGSLLLQEVFVTAGELDEVSGYVHSLDLQGIWARVKSGQSSELRLALRMNNGSSSAVISNLEMEFMKNNFGLTFDPNVELLGPSKRLPSGDTASFNLTLFCSPENQMISNDPEMDVSLLTVRIKYSVGTTPMTILHTTHIPLHIFFIDHPQSDPTNYVSNPDTLSCTDDGPRLTQTSFLSIWPRPSISSTHFSFAGVKWKRWYTSYAQSGVLQAITGVTFATATPSTREIIKVIERKLSTNRIYVVASREIPNPSSEDNTSSPLLVFFCSFKVGDSPITSTTTATYNANGVLVLAEVRLSGSDWDQCDVALKSPGNTKLWGGLKRAVRAILLS